MRLLITAVLGFVFASSIVAAEYYDLYTRDIDSFPSLSILKREAIADAYAEGFADAQADLIYARSPYAYDDAFSGLISRNNDKAILDYLRNIDTRTSTGSFNKDMWTRVHGDSKSSIGGNLHIETGNMQGKNQVRLIQSGVKGSGAVLKTLPMPRPAVGCAIHQLRVAYGGPKPPSGGC